MNEKNAVVYHSADFDGLFCREIARKFLPGAELIGWDYGNPKLPFPEGRVYVLDLSPDCFDTSYTDECNDRLIWIDHHKSAIEKFWSTIPGYRIDGVAACRLAWQWFATLDRNTGCPEAPLASDTARAMLPYKADYFDRLVTEPYAVRLAGEYDIWDKRDPNAELFQHGLRSQDLNENIWELLLVPSMEKHTQKDIGTITVEALLDAGKAIQYARTKENESIIKAAGFTYQWEGLTFLCCNHARYNSHLFTGGLTPEHDACLGFAWKNGQWTVSLYHAPGKEHHDLSLLAIKYGGGGHRGACGFRTSTLPFLV